MSFTACHTYLYSKHFTVITDHQPLEKNFPQTKRCASPRLRRMLIRTHGYDFTVKHRLGTTVVDALSRAVNPFNKKPSLENALIQPLLKSISCTLPRTSKFRQQKIMHALYGLATIIKGSWPATIQEVPVVDHTKEVLSLFGCPRTRVSDNGPQFR